MAEYLISLSFLICAILLIRDIFRKTVSPRAVYALWLVVVIRMLLPITLFEVNMTFPAFMQNQQAEQLPNDSGATADESLQLPSNFPLLTIPATTTQSTTPVTPTYPSVTTPVTPLMPIEPVETSPLAPITPETESKSTAITEETTSGLTKKTAPVNWKRIADTVWFIGAVIVAVWMMFISITYSRRLLKDRRLHRTVRGTKVYISDNADVPCIVGLIPSIYITPEAANSKSEMLIIIHEHIHLRHGDHIWAIVRALALIVFWWNPLVWAAATVSKQDAELACDDAISAKLNEDGRLKYANILIDTIPQKHRYVVGFGSAPMKERILRLTKKQKNRWVCLVLTVLLTVSAVGCSFIGTCKITMDNIQEQKGFTILSQKTKEVTLNLPVEKVPSYDEIVSVEGARLEIEDIPVFTTDTTEIFLHTVGVYGHEPEGTESDVLYLGFDIRHNLTEVGLIYTVNRVMNESGSHTYSSVFSLTEDTLQEYNRGIRLMGHGPTDNFYLYVDASLFTALRGDVNIGITLNEMVYERGSEVKIYGENTSQEVTSEADQSNQQVKTYNNMAEYMLYDTSAKQEILFSDWLKKTGYAISKYSVIDLNGDSKSEMVLWLARGKNEYVGFLILHSEQDTVYAYEMPYRAFTELKEDGTFGFSGGVSDHGIGRIDFSGDTYTVSKVAYCESDVNQQLTFFIDNKSVSKDDFTAYESAQSQKQNAVWHEYEIYSIQKYYQMWCDGEITADELMSKPGVMDNFIERIKRFTGYDLYNENFTWTYVTAEDRYPFIFTITNEDDMKITSIEAIVIRYKDGEDIKYSVEVNPNIIQ